MKSSLSTPKIAVKSLTPITGSNKRAKSPRTLDEILHAVNLLLNLEVKFELRSPGELIVTDRRAALILPTQQQPESEITAHPFQVYKLEGSQLQPADKNSPTKVAYTFRSGYIEVRPRWIAISGSAYTLLPGNYSFYADEVGGGSAFDRSGFGDDVEQVSPTGRLGFEGSYFTCDPTPEVDGSSGLNWGSYYSVYIQITDSTPNAFPVIEMKSRRFSRNPSTIFANVAFPVTTADIEIIPIAIIQLSPEQAVEPIIYPNFGVGIIAPSNVGPGYISQIQWTNLVNRFDRLGIRNQGEFDPAQHRVYYPNDLVSFTSVGPDDPNYGWWIATSFGENGPGVTTPDTGGAGFVYYANPNPPSVTNPP